VTFLFLNIFSYFLLAGSMRKRAVHMSFSETVQTNQSSNAAEASVALRPKNPASTHKNITKHNSAPLFPAQVFKTFKKGKERENHVRVFSS
jgi:hypothetical protein